MSKANHLNDFLLRVSSDSSLSTSHVSFCTALCSAWIKNKFDNPMKVSRKVIMEAAKIKSISTYHKILKDLTNLKYFEYTPSYHPLNGSEFLILVGDNSIGAIWPVM